MFIFGVDIPLLEIIIVISVILFVLLIEVLVIIIFLLPQVNKINKAAELLTKASLVFIEDAKGKKK